MNTLSCDAKQARELVPGQAAAAAQLSNGRTLCCCCIHRRGAAVGLFHSNKFSGPLNLELRSSLFPSGALGSFGNGAPKWAHIELVGKCRRAY